MLCLCNRCHAANDHRPRFAAKSSGAAALKAPTAATTSPDATAARLVAPVPPPPAVEGGELMTFWRAAELTPDTEHPPLPCEEPALPPLPPK